MRSYNVASETGMFSLGKSDRETTLRFLWFVGQLYLENSSRHGKVLTRSGSWKRQSKQEASLKTAPRASHQASTLFRGKTGLFPTETHERTSSASACVILRTQGQAGSFPTIFSTQMLGSRRIPQTAW